MKKYIFMSTLLLLFMVSNFSAQIFNDKITVSELEAINKGELVVRNIEKSKNIGIQPFSPYVDKAIKTIVDLKPAYLAEVIQIIPYKGNEDLLERLEKLLINVQDYAGIPYYSVQHKAYFDLYSSAKLKEIKQDEHTTTLNADLEMDPFGVIDTSITIEKNSDGLYYENTNLNNLKYSGFTVAKKGKMKSVITVSRLEDNWILYGIGGVDAPSIFFLRDRIEVSFMNRIKTMCSYFFENI